MIKSSSTFTSLVSDAPGVDPKLLELPLLSSSEAFVAAVNEVFPDPLSCVDDFDMCPDLVSDDGSSQRYVCLIASSARTRLKLIFALTVLTLSYAPLKPTIILLFLMAISITFPPTLPPPHSRRPPVRPQHAASWPKRNVLEESRSSKRAADTPALPATSLSNAATMLNATSTLQAYRLSANTAGNPLLGGATLVSATWLKTRNVGKPGMLVTRPDASPHAAWKTPSIKASTNTAHFWWANMDAKNYDLQGRVFYPKLYCWRLAVRTPAGPSH